MNNQELREKIEGARSKCLSAIGYAAVANYDREIESSKRVIDAFGPLLSLLRPQTREQAIEKLLADIGFYMGKASGLFFGGLATHLVNKGWHAGYSLSPELTLISDEKIEDKVKQFWGKYTGKGLSPSEVMELHHSELFEEIAQAQLSHDQKRGRE
jgi:hypothetical protein